MADTIQGLGSSVLEGNVLAAEQQAARSAAPLDGVRPCDSGFDRVTRPPDIHVGNHSQRCRLLDRLMGGPIFAQADRIVGVDEDVADFHQRRHPQCIARVFGKHEKCSRVGNESAMQRHAVGNRRHAKFPHAIVDVIAALQRVDLR